MVVVANGRLWRSITLRSSEGSATRIAVEPSTAIGRSPAAKSSPARASAASGAGASFPGRAGVRGGERDILRQIEMRRPLGLGERQRNRLRDRLGDAAPLEPKRRLGDRLEQRVVVNPHLYAPAELIGI